MGAQTSSEMMASEQEQKVGKRIMISGGSNTYSNTIEIEHTSNSSRLKRERSQKKRVILSKPVKFVLRLSCTLIVFALLLRSISWNEVIGQLRYLDSGLILIAVLVGALGVVISSYQWQCLLHGERIRVDLGRLVNFYLIGIAFNHFLPTGMGGDVVKAYYVGRDGGNTAGSVSAVMMSRITGFLGMLCISLPALIIWQNEFEPHIFFVYLLSCCIMCVGLIVAFGAVSLLPKVFKGRLAEHKVVRTIIDVGMALRISITRPWVMAGAVAFGVLYHLSYALNYYAFANVLHLQVPFTFYLVAVPLTALIAFLPFSINGFGLRESAFVYIFASMHVPAASALLLALLMDVQVLLFGVVGGIIYLIKGESRGRVEEGRVEKG